MRPPSSQSQTTLPHGPDSSWAQGSLRLMPPWEILPILERRGFSGRLVLISASSPRRVVVLHLEQGHPHSVAGSGLPHEAGAELESHAARQVLIESLSWTRGSFRVEARRDDEPRPPSNQTLAEPAALIRAAAERASVWTQLLSELPGEWNQLHAARCGATFRPRSPAEKAVHESLAEPKALRDLPAAVLLDEHVVLQAVVDLARAGAITVAGELELGRLADPELPALVRALLETLPGESEGATALKITVLSWDARTCFRAIEALAGRSGRPPEDVEQQPRYQIQQRVVPAGDGMLVEILAFRADAFEPSFAAPLVHDCHLFLLFTDIEAGHLWGAERPLVERVDEIRNMFQGTVVAGRITIGAGAVTDPGTDILLPELGRYLSWSDLRSGRFLVEVLREVVQRLGFG